MANEFFDDAGLRSIEIMGRPAPLPFMDAPVTGDVVAPVVALVSPLTGTVLPDAAIQFDVTDDTSLSFHTIFAEYPGLDDFDVVWTGTVFAPKYSTSSRLSVTGGWRYTINRDDGWRTSPNIHVHAVDGGGNTDV